MSQILLDRLTKLEAVLTGAVAANQPRFTIVYRDQTNDGQWTNPGFSRGTLNGVTDQVLVGPAVDPNVAREVIGLTIYNQDTAAVEVAIKTDDGTTEIIMMRPTLATKETSHYHNIRGWYTTKADGGVK